MNPYILTLQIAGGILTPIILILIIAPIVVTVQAWRDEIKMRKIRLERREIIEHAKVEIRKVPNPTMVGLQLVSGGKVIWTGGIDKEDLSKYT